MKIRTTHALSFCAGFVWLLAVSSAARAEDIELFVGNAAANTTARPNILLILDDSGSMGSTVITQNNYDPATTYPSVGCDPSRVYFSTNGTPPTCGTSNWFNWNALQCKHALDAFSKPLGGTYTDNMAQYDPRAQDRWENISSFYKDRLIECQDDRPDPSSGWPGHGSTAGGAAVYAQNGDDLNPWTTDPTKEISWGQWPVDRVYTLYSGNYMNWYYGAATTSTRIKVMQDVATNLINSVNGVNIGVMGFNFDEGGYVHHAIENVATARSSLVQTINSMTASNWTPLSETMHEAYEYLSGSPVIYGNTSDPASLDPNNSGQYESPIDFECQKTHVVLLTDGEPTQDHSSDTAIPNLVDRAGESFLSLTGSNTCDVETYPASLSPDTGHCLDDLAEFMHKGDLSPLTGRQAATVHTVGFLIDLPVLKETAERGGGEYYTADDTATLNSALTTIITNILDTQATFTAPAVSINSFNRTRNLDDLFISVFKPSGTTHWPGNLKKYRIRASDATIVDANGVPAIDPSTGFFADTSRSFWSVGVDGSNIQAGGAAALIPTTRNVYTYLGNAALTNATNKVSIANTAIDDALLNTGNPGDPTRDEVINFINGLDASDVDQDNILNEPREQMGDPLHSQPVSVVYGPAVTDATIYFGTNDGYLHAIDADTGVERWAFVPPEFIGNQIEYFKDNQSAVGSKFYGVDGSLRVQFIGDNDGIVEPGEKVFLFFGMRRGGDAYYALDVTQRDQPVLMWHKDSTNLPGIGQSWSSVSPTKMNISGVAQNADKAVLVIGGGYDPSQDNYTASTDGIGNSIYFVDSETGALLWHGSNANADRNFDTSTTNRAMNYSIPSDIRVIDLNGDQFADRMYAADMGGQVWRFDIFNGQPKSTLVTGGVLAQLGAAGMASPTLADTRRFYYAPDVALVNNDEFNYMHIGIGSGYRSHPNEATNQNRYYALRDYDTFTAISQPAYRAITPVTDADLVDVTTNTTASVPQGAPGWKLLLNDGGWRGEKVLAETRTFNNQVYVTTYRPGTAGNGCQPALGTNRQYIMSIYNGSPVTNLDNSSDPTVLTETDRYTEWLGAPPPETVFIFADDPACVGSQCPPVQCVDVNCGLTNFDSNPRRTFWTEEIVD